MIELTLKDCVLKLKEKDNSVFDFLYNQTKSQVFYNILSFVKNYESSEDILQDTYVQFLKNIEKVNENDSILGYLIKISRNLSVDYFRKNKKTRQLDEEVDIISINDSVNIDEEDLVSKIKKILSDNEFSVLIRHIYGELTFKEISHDDKKPLGTILWIYNKAIKKLRKELTNEEN